jgi:hypothetical protein
MRQKRLSGQLLLLLIAHCGVALFAANTNAQSSDGAQWSITPYIWASDTSLDFSLDGSPVGGADLSFNDILDTLDAAFQVHVESGKGNWSGFVDFTFLSMSDSEDLPIVRIDTDSEQIVLDAAAAYWPGGVGSPLNLFGGVRYSGFDDTFGLSVGGTPVGETRSKQDYIDALLGIRYRFDLSDRWGLLTHGDVSFGDSEGTWQLQGLFAYAVGKKRRNNILFGYRYKQAEFEDGALTTDYAFNGPIAGFAFVF